MLRIEELGETEGRRTGREGEAGEWRKGVLPVGKEISRQGTWSSLCLYGLKLGMELQLLHRSIVCCFVGLGFSSGHLQYVIPDITCERWSGILDKLF